MKNFYEDMLHQNHILVAGCTGSGKSVVINGLINEILKHSPAEQKMILIDPKRVELIAYSDTPHAVYYGCHGSEMVEALKYAIQIVERRNEIMQERRIKKYTGSHLWVIIDEFADLMTTNAKEITPMIQRICQIGRAARVHVVAATQCPLTSVIPTTIKVNFDSIVALSTVTAQHSRNIMGMNGCEKLPRYGKCFYITPDRRTEYKTPIDVPMVNDDEISATLDRWIDKPAKPAMPAMPMPEIPETPKKRGFFSRLFG